MRQISDEDLRGLAKAALSLGMSIGEASEAARVMAQDMTKRREVRKAAHRDFIKSLNRRWARS